MRIILFALSVLAYKSVDALHLESEEQDFDQALQFDFLSQTYAEDIPAIGACMTKQLKGADDKKASEATKCGAPAPAPKPKVEATKKPTEVKAEEKCGGSKAPDAKAKVEEKQEEAKKKSDDATAKATTDVKAALDKAQA